MIYRWTITTEPTSQLKYRASLEKSPDRRMWTTVGRRYDLMAGTKWGIQRQIRRAIRNDLAAYKASGERAL